MTQLTGEQTLQERYLSGGYKVLPDIEMSYVLAPDANAAQLQSRLVYNVPREGLAAIRQLSVLFVGLGVMGKTADDLARLGAGDSTDNGQDQGNIILVDVPGDIGGLEVSNLNRQVGEYARTKEYREAAAGKPIGGAPKAENVAKGILDVNPHANVHAISKILTQEEIDFLARRADVIFWGHDDPVSVMHLLEAAKKYGVPVFSGLDLGPNAYLTTIINTAETAHRPVLGGRVTMKQAEAGINRLTFLARSAEIPIEKIIPVEVLRNLMAMIKGETPILSQTPFAVDTFTSQTAYRVAQVADLILAHKLTEQALSERGIVQHKNYKMAETNLTTKARLKREYERLQLLSDKTIQGFLGFEKGIGKLRFAQIAISGMFSALIGK